MLKIGCDPEFFLKHDKFGFVSAHDLVPGTKDSPFKLEKGAVQADGTAVEFNIEPASTADEFHENIMCVLKQIRSMIDPKLKFYMYPTVQYERKYFDSLPEMPKELGCTPDYNAYNDGKANPRPNNNTTMRTGAGHIHVGWTEDVDPFDKSHMYDCIVMTKNLDKVFTHVEKVFDNDTDRRRLYGAPGAFRPKTYGVEYRVPSNAWLRYPSLHKAMFELTSFVYKTVNGGSKINYVLPLTSFGKFDSKEMVM